MSALRRAVVFFAVSGVSVAFDQVTKLIATDTLKGGPTRTYLGDTFRLAWATNDGAFLSLGSTLPPTARYWVLTVGVGALLLGLAVHALRNAQLDGKQIAAYGLIVSGGFSNWVDRARFGGVVVDFMNVGLGPVRSGIFNVADLAILAGIGMLLLHGEPKKPAPAVVPVDGATPQAEPAATPAQPPESGAPTAEATPSAADGTTAPAEPPTASPSNEPGPTQP